MTTMYRIIATVLFGLLMTWLSGCKKNYVQEEDLGKPNVKRVRVKELVPTQAPIAIVASGVLASESEMTLSFKIGGVVEAVVVDEGQYVRQGQLLAKLDLAEINAQVVQARNNFDKTKRDLRRVESLYADTVATLEQKQDAHTAFKVAQAALDIAEFNLRYAKIVAPVNGKVLKRSVEPNELVSAGQPLFVLGSSGNRGAQVINIGLADEDVVKVALQDTASLAFDAFPGKKYGARVTEISEAANPATGTFSIELTLEGQYSSELKNGFVAKVSLFPSGVVPYYNIPMTALVEGDQKWAKVYLTNDKKTVYGEVLPVSGIHEDYFTVSQDLGILQPAWVVLEGGAYLREKDTIEILATAP